MGCMILRRVPPRVYTRGLDAFRGFIILNKLEVGGWVSGLKGEEECVRRMRDGEVVVNGKEAGLSG
jgi:hypothetical protein